MILEELATYVALNSTFAVGTDLFMDQIPATAPDQAVALYESGGIPASEVFNGVAFETPSIQVVTRSTSYASARNIAQMVFNLIVKIENTVLSTSTSPGPVYVSGKAQQSPFSIGVDGKDRPQVSCNYYIEKEVSTT